MKDGLDMVTEAYKLVNVVDITSAITGDLYKLKRPQNSQLEDVVIKSLAISGNQIQNGLLLINIHVPNLSNLKIKGGQADNTMPNTERMKAIYALIEPKVKDVATQGFRMWINQPALPYQDTDGSWYLNIRINYLFFQNNYTNI